MITKGIRLHLDLETHKWIEKIQFAELSKFDYLERRKKEDIAADILKIGIQEFIKTHDLDIRL